MPKFESGTKLQPAQVQNLFATRRITRSLYLGLLLLPVLAVVTTFGQNSDPIDPQRGAASGASFSISDIESINLTNGNLMLNLPLVSLPPTRGGLSASIGLSYNSKLYRRQIEHALDQNGNPKDQNFLYPIDGGGWRLTNSLDYEFILTNRFNTNEIDCADGPDYAKNAYRWKVNVRFPDGNQREFVPVGYSEAYGDGHYNVSPNGRSLSYSYSSGGCSSSSSQSTSDMTYRSIDGTFIRMVVTHDYDTNDLNNPYTLYFPDGKVFTSSNKRLTDPNGNYIEPTTFTYGGQTANGITDQLGRKIFTTAGSGTDVNVIRLGVGGDEVKWVVKYTDTHVRKQYRTTGANSLRGKGSTSDQEFQTYYDDLVGEIQLPCQYDDQTSSCPTSSLKYEFGYNGSASDPGPGNESPGWGYLDYIKMPSGAEVNYEYAIPTGTVNTDRVIASYVSEKELEYALEHDSGPTQDTDVWTYAIGTISSTVTGPDGGSTTQTHGNTLYDDPHSGLVKSVTSPNGTKVEKLWAFEGSGATGINPYVKFEFTSLWNGSSHTLTSTKEISQDRNGNTTSVKEYDFVSYGNIGRTNGFPSDPPSGYGSPARQTYTTYYHGTPDISDTTTSSSYNYWSFGGIKNLPKSVEVQNPSSQAVSRTEFYYDSGGYSSSPSDGNLTETRAWDSTKGSLPSADWEGKKLYGSVHVATSSTYDSYGNVTAATDARGYSTVMTYGNISGPGGPVSGLYPTQTEVAAGQTVERTFQAGYDFYTGVVTSATDYDNSVTTVTEYDDLGRPTKVRDADGSALESWIRTTYNDVNRYVIVESDLAFKGDYKRVEIQHFDELGRVHLSRTLEDSTAQDPTDKDDGIKVQTRYKSASGYSYQLTSNPYRASTASGASGEETMGWTLSTMWNHGRRSEVQTFTGSTLPAAFSGSDSGSTGIVRTDIDAERTLVTDQAGKQRISKSNALGHLLNVWEVMSSSDGSTVSVSFPGTSIAYGYQTNYSYDTLNNLTAVDQGSVDRTYAYSSLSRLTSGTNPESGQYFYTYDNNGNLLQREDAIGTIAYYTYDPLNRVTYRSYDDGTTPAVTYTYDNVTNAKGKLTKVSNANSATELTAFDVLGRVTAHKQTISSTDFTTAYTYNLAGMVLEETYPSGRVVKNTIGTNGNLSQVETKPSGGSFSSRATNFVYNAPGAVQSLQLGNSKYETTQFNARLQPVQVGLGTSTTDTSLLKLEYGFGTTSNNGNVITQKITVPGLSYAFEQNYTYDSLNRIASVVENFNGSQLWTQVYGYDRYGNRNITSGTGATSLTFDSTNNRITTSGYSYDSNGNTTADPSGKSFTYDAENKQLSVSNGGTIGAYLYDGDGKRVKKHNTSPSDNRLFIYDAMGRLVEERSTTGQLALQTSYIYAGSRLLAVEAEKTGNTNYLTADHLGSPRINTDGSGNVTARHDYMPFGEEIYPSLTPQRTTGVGYVPDGIRKQFTGYERDKESSLDFAQARMYASGLARFTTADPIFAGDRPGNPESFNRYTYCANNPFLYIDPTGLIYVYQDSPDGKTRTFRWYDREKDIPDGWTKYSGSIYFMGATEGVFLGAKGNMERISLEQAAMGQLDEFLRGPKSPLSLDEKAELQRQFVDRITSYHWEDKLLASLVGPLLASMSEAGLRAVGSALIANGAKAETAALAGFLRETIKTKSNFGMKLDGATFDLNSANALGRAWVGEGYTVASDGVTLVSKDLLRQYRPPVYKPAWKEVQANFEWRYIPSGKFIGNGHLSLPTP